LSRFFGVGEPFTSKFSLERTAFFPLFRLSETVYQFWNGHDVCRHICSIIERNENESFRVVLRSMENLFLGKGGCLNNIDSWVSPAVEAVSYCPLVMVGRGDAGIEHCPARFLGVVSSA
jgi:hypothetical protein